MPEYHNVEAYLSLERRTTEEGLAMYSSVLAANQLLSPPCAGWLEEVSAGLAAESGYPPRGPALRAPLGPVVVDVAPLALLWTSEAFPSLSAPWLQIGLLLESERIERPQLQEPRYRPELEAALFQLVASFAPISVDAPVFLTNEATDGLPWEALIADEGDAWAFDLAVAGPGLAGLFTLVPAGHARAKRGDLTLVARRAAWHHLPWA